MDKGKNRIWELDFLRGFAIIMMIFDHLMYDFMSFPAWFINYSQRERPGMEALVDFAVRYWGSDLRAVGHWVFLIIFFLVSGISFTFSRNNFQRGLRFVVFGALVYGITALGEQLTGQQMTVFAGVIQMFAMGTLVTAILRKIWDNDIFILAMGTISLIVGFTAIRMGLPYSNQLTWSNVVPVLLGFRQYGGDYFGLLPYAGFIMYGTVLGRLVYRNRLSLVPSWDGRWNAPFTFVGRHSIWFFLIHQLVLFGILTAVGYALGYHF
ncbi:MAG TPA: heparan-alpha-glucosaminide N-acetyltransferase domain-containing protein [Bacillota bacterium]|nr:heparan-alpha-glucosaminide N-acetyltransferase domain-containing protein [Bacillota bacterium]